MIRCGFAFGCFALVISTQAAEPPVVAPKPHIASPNVASPVAGCDACRFLSLPPRRGAIVPVEDGPDLRLPGATPEPLPPPVDATPLPAADADLELRTLIDQSMPNATADERRVWLEELRGLPLPMARDLLSVRMPVPGETPPVGPESSETLPEPPIQSEPDDPGSLAPLRSVQRRQHAKTTGHATTLTALRQVEATLLHNIANAGTAGFKRLDPLTSDALGTAGLAGVHSRRTETQGDLEPTGRLLDLAIDGDGYFQVRQGDTVALTRRGNLTVTPDGDLAILLEGTPWILHPPIRLPDEAERVVITEAGAIGSLLAGETFVPAGQIQLARVLDASELEPAGGGLLAVPDTAGPATVGLPGGNGFGAVRQGFLEGSNVDLDHEMRALERVRTQIAAFDEAASDDGAAPSLLATPRIDVSR